MLKLLRISQQNNKKPSALAGCTKYTQIHQKKIITQSIKLIFSYESTVKGESTVA